MAKKFISFLGTTDYAEVFYELNGIKTESKVKFVQQALIQLTCKNFDIRKDKIIIICGPTASGKSDLAIECAKLLDTEIVSADSMYIYKNVGVNVYYANMKCPFHSDRVFMF